ncbi:MAG: acyl-CoA dehydrogenase family protein [Ectothiorhodospiraceae bacterium]|nr:acyl-CoA dehydrogenase family protein [Ectothiorhodospiraceae bacterium]
MIFDLTDEQREAVTQFRRFAEDRVRPVTEPLAATSIEKDVALSLMREVLPFGIGSGWIPEEHGGLEMGYLTSGLLYEELNRVSAEFAGIAFINEGAALMLSRLATPEVRDRYLRRMLGGELIGATAVTEPSGGSDVKSIRTRAKRVGDHYVLSGRKIWISNGHNCDFLVVLAQTESGQGLFVVDRDEHGFESRKLDMLGFRSWGLAEIVLDEVQVPVANLLGSEGHGLVETLKLFQHARSFVAIGAIGIAAAALDCAISYAKTRTQFGKTIAEHQLIQAHIAEMATDLDAARLLAYRSLAMADRGERYEKEGAMAKFFASEAAVRIASAAVQVHGGYGLSAELPVERHFRNARMMTIPEGTSEVQKLIIGRSILGVSAF